MTYRNWVNIKTEHDKIPVGFDMEWPIIDPKDTEKSSKTALIQFCCSTSVCYLFQVWEHKTLPETLVDLLQHKRFLLHGNYIKG